MFIIFDPEIPLLVIFSKEIIRQICKNSRKYVNLYCDNGVGLPVSADWHLKSLEVSLLSSQQTKKANQTENQLLFLDPSKKQGHRANCHIEIWRDSQVQRITAEIRSRWSPVTGRKKFKGNFDTLLEAECG